MGVIKVLIAFTAGAGCGIFATRSYFANKYKEIADEEIASMKEVVDRKIAEDHMDKEIVEQYHQEVDNYISSVPPTKATARPIRNNVDDSPSEFDSPFEINTEEWLEDGYFDKLSLTYYEGDNVLVSDDVETDSDGPFADIEDTIGIDIFEEFRSGPEDEIYVRNPNTGVDYMLIKDPRKYNE